MQITGYATDSKGGQLRPIKYTLRELGPNDVLLRISHCGICHSDIHLIDDDWGITQFPLVPGHEIIGEVEATGTAVKRFAPGMRVGVGWQHRCCGDCEWCLKGDENLCAGSEGVCVTGYGGFSEALVCDQRFVFAIPDAVDPVTAAPLLCGGITVYTPFQAFDVRPTMSVGIIGIGGLGHLAIQFARAMGCEVTALSTSADKEEEARALGAQHFVHSRQEGALEGLAGRFDFILSTITAAIDWAPYIQALRPRGRLCFVGAAGDTISVPTFGLILGQRSVCGSPIGSPQMIREMFHFAERSGVHARTETFALKDVNQALDHVRKNQARYRVVLDCQSVT
jgi:uncharacterized zinc-type alcohol dehydrogenase-like protein